MTVRITVTLAIIEAAAIDSEFASPFIIEVDGAYHSEPRQQIDDAQRTYILQSLGYRVIRFTNEEILFDIDKVLHTIIIEL